MTLVMCVSSWMMSWVLRGDHRVGRQARLLDQLRQLRRHLRERQRRVHQVRADEDHEDHRRALRRFVLSNNESCRHRTERFAQSHRHPLTHRSPPQFRYLDMFATARCQSPLAGSLSRCTPVWQWSLSAWLQSCRPSRPLSFSFSESAGFWNKSLLLLA